MKKPTLETVDASIARWQTRLRRAVRAIEKLERQKKRLVKAQASPPARPRPVPAKVPAPEIVAPAPAVAPAIDTSIPSFLKRTPDPVAEQIKTEQAETKRRKAAGRIAKMKAKQSGELSRMPLTGRAALDAIRNG
jgi:hypothetical protein